MNLKQIRQDVMTSENINQLYEIELDLVEHIGTLHRGIMLADTTIEQSEAKSNLSMVNALLEICRDRQSEVKDTGGRLNYNFRMAARVMLTRDTYNSIMDKARLPRKEVKEETSYLKANKVSL